MDTSIITRYQLDHCVNWILDNKFKRVVIQLKKEDLKHSHQISTYLKNKHFSLSGANEKSSLQNCDSPLDIYITQSNTCCVDLLVTQHVSNIDAIIFMGNVCLTKPVIQNSNTSLPILFAFEATSYKATFDSDVESIRQSIHDTAKTIREPKMCLLYDTNLTDYAIKLQELFQEEQTNFLDVVDLYCPDKLWHTTPPHERKFIGAEQLESKIVFGHYLLQKPLADYNAAIYLGTRPSIQLALECPAMLIRINCYENTTIEQIRVNRLLNRRMALVDRLQDDEELKIGVIITNPLPDVTESISRLESYAKLRKHTLYFISMIQTIDECKIGNFDLCDAFIVVNSCTCSTILESLVFNRPIVTEHEFKLACGLEATYGGVLWPGKSSHPIDGDISNRRKVSDVALALVHTRNELLERCSQARLNKWSGLNYKRSESASNLTEAMDSLVIEKGLDGTASSYLSEPLDKNQQNNEPRPSTELKPDG